MTWGVSEGLGLGVWVLGLPGGDVGLLGRVIWGFLTGSVSGGVGIIYYFPLCWVVWAHCAGFCWCFGMFCCDV